MTTSAYVRIWAALVALLLVSLALGYVGHRVLAATLVFSVAALKALLVIGWYMHVRLEPRLVRLILAGGLGCLLVLFFVLVPDIVHGWGR